MGEDVKKYTTEHPNSIIAVEGITRPSWHIAADRKHGSASDPTALIGTAMMLGAILSHYPTATLIQPNKNGSKPLGAYPPQLVSTQEKRHHDWKTRIGTGKLRHARSAYDIAITANEKPLP